MRDVWRSGAAAAATAKTAGGADSVRQPSAAAGTPYWSTRTYSLAPRRRAETTRDRFRPGHHRCRSEGRAAANRHRRSRRLRSPGLAYPGLRFRRQDQDRARASAYCRRTRIARRCEASIITGTRLLRSVEQDHPGGAIAGEIDAADQAASVDDGLALACTPFAVPAFRIMVLTKGRLDSPITRAVTDGMASDRERRSAAARSAARGPRSDNATFLPSAAAARSRP